MATRSSGVAADGSATGEGAGRQSGALVRPFELRIDCNRRLDRSSTSSLSILSMPRLPMLPREVRPLLSSPSSHYQRMRDSLHLSRGHLSCQVAVRLTYNVHDISFVMEKKAE